MPCRFPHSPDCTCPTTALTPEREQEIRADLAAVPAPPWRWIGNRGAGGPQLVTDHSGRQYLLRAAKPVDGRGDELLDPEGDYPIYGDLQFRDQRDGEKYSQMRTGAELGIGRTSYDPDNLISVDNAVANWLMKSAAHAAALLAELDRVRAETERLRLEASGLRSQLSLHKEWRAQDSDQIVQLGMEQDAHRAKVLNEAADLVAADTEIHIRHGSATDYANRHAALLRAAATEKASTSAAPELQRANGDPIGGA
ncbi:hypothetical protein [Streptomyces niveus]